MKIKQMLLWQFQSSRSAFIIFFCIMLALTAVLTILFFNLSASGNSGNMSFNMAAAPIGVFFLFVVGCASFAENLHLAFANGVSRKTHFFSFLIFSVVVSILTAVLCLLIDKIPSLSPSTYVPPTVSSVGMQIVFYWMLNLGIMALGYFIAGAFYRMNKTAKIAASILIPAAVIIFVALITNTSASSGTSFDLLPLLIAWMSSGLMNAAFFWLLFSLLFFLFGWLVTRHAGLRRQQSAA